MRTSFTAFFLTALSLGAAGQTPAASTITNAPAASPFGFTLPATLGTLTYSLSGSESFVTGYGNGDVDYTTALSGNLAYLSNSTEHPFSLVYSGGYLYSDVTGGSAAQGVYPGQASSTTFQSLAFSQEFQTKRWVFLIADAVSYLPQSPTTGLSGIAGVGDLGIDPVQNGLEPDQSILTDYGSRVSNGLNGSASWQTTSRVSLEASGAWQTLRFLDGQGIDSNSYSGTFGPSYRYDERNTFAASGYYSRSTFSSYNQVIESDGVTFQYNHVWSRRFSTSVGAGPQFTHGSGTIPFPNQTSVSAQVSANYTGERTTGNLSYSRGSNAGSGVLLGALSDTVSAGLSRPLSRNWIVAANLGYSRSSSLAAFPGFAADTQSIFGGIQGSRRISRSLSGYLSYTAIDQSVSNSAATVNAFSGLNHVISAGITFSPAAIHHGR